MDPIEQKDRHEKWKILIEEQEKSGLSQANFCKQKNISSAQFGYYRALQKPKQSEKLLGSFATVKINQSSCEKEIRLNLPNGFQCTFSSSVDAAHIKKLVEALLSC